MGFFLSSLNKYSFDNSRDKRGNVRKIEKVTIEPLKMGIVKSTREVRATACRVTVEYSDNKKEYHHVNTQKDGIYAAYQFGARLVLQNQKERGVA